MRFRVTINAPLSGMGVIPLAGTGYETAQISVPGGICDYPGELS
jgi:hypothetical protein